MQPSSSISIRPFNTAIGNLVPSALAFNAPPDAPPGLPPPVPPSQETNTGNQVAQEPAPIPTADAHMDSDDQEVEDMMTGKQPEHQSHNNDSMDSEEQEEQVSTPLAHPLLSTHATVSVSSKAQTVIRGKDSREMRCRAYDRSAASPSSPFKLRFHAVSTLPTSASVPFSSAYFLFVFFLLSSLLPHVCASHTFNALALNTNGLANPAKLHAVSTLISARSPHAWVVNETKAPHAMHARLHTPDYHVYESNGVALTGSRGGKWGVIMGIHKSLSAQRIPTDDRFQGRLVAIDIVMPTIRGRGFSHRVLGVYAPWDPGDDPEALTDFWSYITSLCNSAPFSWSLLGDCNATLTADESTSGNDRVSPTRLAYNSFLHNTDAFDVWHSQGDADARQHYTFLSHAERSIIDRSRKGVLTASISVLTDYVLAIDHRPILASIELSPPVHHAGAPNLLSTLPLRSYPPRVLYPRRTEKHRFTVFNQAVNEMVHEESLASLPVTDDESFDRGYHALSRIFREASLQSFDTPSVRPPRQLSKPLNPYIRALMTEFRRVNRVIAAVKLKTLNRLCSSASWTRQYLDGYHQTPNALPLWHADYSVSLLDYLTTIRRTLCRLRYRAEKDELQRRATQSSRARIKSVLLGGSSKRLYSHAHDTDGPPLALTDDANPHSFITGPDEIKQATVRYFGDFFSRQERPRMDKPWMDTPSIVHIRLRTKQDPFPWPRPMSLADFRTVLRKGNARPSPGPDLWEKWCLKALGDETLSLVLDLS